jgi:hypothetical protein
LSLVAIQNRSSRFLSQKLSDNESEKNGREKEGFVKSD